ncbi:MAG: solute carrier family 26 protein [Bacteroidia bacterium]|nr:solute carrier family 26 protein [Bacteroidia bacterium]NNC85052.1 solute carrier family 26 protein [Bacteroidia bacterium]
MKNLIPALDWIQNYKKEYLTGDLTAGLTVGVMLIPQGMAYSMLAGLPPIYGLYASTIPLIIYALFGTSRQLAVGPVAMVALLISSGVGALATIGSNEFIALAILLALMVGVIQFAMGIFKLGFLVNFLSHPVIAGFTSAAAIIIGFSQLKHLLGFNIPRGKVHEIILNVIENFGSINVPTLLIGAGAIALLLIIKSINKKIPGPLLAVLFGIGAVYFLGLHEQGVKIVKDVPGGLDIFGIPSIDLTSVTSLIPVALTIAFIGFMESIAVAKAIQAKHKDYEVTANKELIGLGLANIIGSFFKAFPVTGGFSRTAVNDQAGARTGLSSIISAVLIIFTLLFLTEYFYFLPNAILAAIIMVAVFGLIDIKEAKHLLKNDRGDFYLFLITAIGTLTLGIESGILLGVVLSIALVIYKVSYPHVAVLGNVPGTDEFRNIRRFADLETYEDKLILRFDAQLYFANSNYFKDFVISSIHKNPRISHVILDARAVSSIDSSAIHMLHDLIIDLKNQNIALHIVEAIGPLRDKFKKNGITDLMGKEQFHLSIQHAVASIDNGELIDNPVYALQTN